MNGLPPIGDRRRRSRASAVAGEPRKTSAALLVVVVNFRTPDLTLGCLASLEKERPNVPDLAVVVVDNGSGDDSATRIGRALAERGWRDWITLSPLAENLGFSAANNYGVRAATERWGNPPEHVLFLNSDTLVDEGCLAHCLTIMREDPGIGAMSCLLRNLDGSAQISARRFPTPLRSLVGATGLPWKWPRLFGWADTEDAAWDRRVTKRDIDWLGGAFMLVRQEALERIGGFSEEFFFYGEDLEFCHRLARAGFRRHYDPAVGVVHFGGGSSSGPGAPSSEWLSYNMLRARYLVQRRCYGRAAEALLRVTDVAMCMFRLARLRIRGQRGTERYGDTVRTLRLLAGRGFGT